MTPYYDEGGITIYCGDCREILPTLGTFDAVITDGPYGIQHTSTGHELGRAAVARRARGDGMRRAGAENTWHPRSAWDQAFDPTLIQACRPVAPVLAWFGHWRMRRAVEDALGTTARAEIIWAKNCHTGPPCPVARQDERIWLFSAKGIQCKRFDVSVWREDIIPTWSRKLHRNQKPEPLMRRLVSLLLDRGQSLVDPFIGSGTTLVVARDLGVRAVGIDTDERCCATAVERLAQRPLPSLARATATP